MGDIDRIPALPLIACVLAGPIPATLLVALLDASAAQGDFLRLWGTLALFGLAYAALIGVPLALVLLRDPALPWRRWIGSGILAGMLVALIVLGWTALGNARNLVTGSWDAFQLFVLWVAVPLTILSAAFSRAALLLHMRRDVRRGRAAS